jgi:hypothetical protein
MNPLLKALRPSIFLQIFRLVPITAVLLLVAFLILISSNAQGRVSFGLVFAFFVYHAKSWVLTMDRLILRALLSGDEDPE